MHAFLQCGSRNRAIGNGPLCRADRRAYKLFDYYGAPDAERVIILMGSGAEVAEEAVDLMVSRAKRSAC